MFAPKLWPPPKKEEIQPAWRNITSIVIVRWEKKVSKGRFYKKLFLQAPFCQACVRLLPKVCGAEGSQGLGSADQKCGEEVQAKPNPRRSHSCHPIRVSLFHIGRLEKARSQICWPTLETPAPIVPILQPWFHSLRSHGGTLRRLRLLLHQGWINKILVNFQKIWLRRTWRSWSTRIVS